MTVTITALNGAGSTSPVHILMPYEVEYVSRNVVHDLVGDGIAVSLVAPRPRSGDYEVLYEAEADAFACAALHQEQSAFALSETDRPYVGMTYVVDGSVTVRLDEKTGTLWVVKIGYQEVIE